MASCLKARASVRLEGPFLSFPMPSRFQAIFLDAAGTLISVAEPVGETYARIAAAHGINVEAAAVMSGFRSAWKSLPQPQRAGVPADDDERGWWRELVRRCFADATETDLSPPTLDALFADLYSHYAQAAAWTVFPDVVPALEMLGQEHRLFVLSNFDKRLRCILDGHDLSRFFDAMIISSEVGASKPDAHIFKTAADVANASPGACLHIGDDEHFDLLGAQSAGFSARLVKRPEITLETIAHEVLREAVL